MSFLDEPRAPAGWLAPSADYLKRFLALPQLAPVAESCAAELQLHAALFADPTHAVDAAQLDRLADADTRDNYRHFLRFRDTLLRAGTLEGGYLALMRGGPNTLPPAFIEDLVQHIVSHLMAGVDDAFEQRAADLLWRPQRISLQDGRWLAADRDTADLLNDTGGFGALGRLLKQGDVPWRSVELQVLSTDNAAEFFQERSDRPAADASPASPTRPRHRFVLDLTQALSTDLGHGLTIQLRRAHSGTQALARVLERWLAHLLGVAVRITPLQKIDDAAWRWHVGLDVDASALLNDLYEGLDIAPERLARLVSLFKLEFTDRAEMRADVAGKPVYLGLAHGADGVLKLKPQNLLLNLPLARAM